KKNGIALPPGEFGIPPEDPAKPDRSLKARLNTGDATSAASIAQLLGVGQGRTVVAGGMVYVSAVGPVDPETGQLASSAIKDQTRRCLGNLKAQLEAAGSSLDRVVWANWALRDATEFDQFNEEWNRWFPGDPPIGQLTLLPSLQRRAGFRVSLGVIAEASATSA
ncbi:MAG: RidA family protein, partial [Chloroflexota bacterium]